MLILLLPCVCSCRPRASVDSRPATRATSETAVAVVAGSSIAVDAFREELARAGQRADKESVLLGMIRREALLARAKEAGYERDPQVVQAYEQLLIRRYCEDQRGGEGGADPAVSETASRAYYEQHAADFVRPEARLGAVILVRIPHMATEQKRAELRARAEDIRRQAADAPADATVFAQLAARFSDDRATRYRGGDTGWLTKAAGSRWGPDLVDALFAIDHEHAIAPILETPGGYHIVRLDAIKPRCVLPFEEVREQVEYLASRQEGQAMEDALFTRAMTGLDIQINRALVDSVPAAERPADAVRPPSLPDP